MSYRPAAVLLCLELLSLTGLIGCRSKPQAKQEEKLECNFILPQSKANIQDFVEYTGRTAAVESVDIKARVTGFLLEVVSPRVVTSTVGALSSPAGAAALGAASSLYPGSSRKTFQEGAPVRKGQELFLIDPEPYDAQLKQAEAQAGLYKAQVELNTVTYEQAKKLKEKNENAF